MNKNELVKEIATSMGLNQAKTKDILTKTFDVIAETAKKEKIEIHGFGSFKTVVRKARTARNPRTGDEVQIPERKMIKFKPEPRLRDIQD